MNRRPHCAACGHHHTDRCTATTHHPITDGATKCGCTGKQDTP